MEEAILVLLVIGLTEVLKRTVGLEKRFEPLSAVVLSLIIAFLAKLGSGISFDVIEAIKIGLIACGLYDVGKKSLLNK